MILRATLLVALAIAAYAISGTAAQAAPAAMPTVEAHGRALVAGGRPFRAFGFNHTFNDVHPCVDYFAAPSPARLRRVRSDFASAARLGANTVRVYLELPAFMRDPVRPRRTALLALRRVLKAAERQHLYLDITGALDWHQETATAWYDALSERERWRTQARFWRAVARVTRESPAVLLYELTSEPTICDDGEWHAGEMEGHWFVQCIVRHLRGRDPHSLARSWTRGLRRAIRSEDRTHLISIGLLPQRGGPFDPANVADLVDVIVLHEYPVTGGVAESINRVRYFAHHGRPLVLGETFMLLSDQQTFERFLVQAAPYLDGTLSFFDGRTPQSSVGNSPAEALYRDNLQTMLKLRPLLLGR